MTSDTLPVDVAFALPGEQFVVSLTLARGSVVADAIRESGFTDRFQPYLPEPLRVGIYGRLVEDPTSCLLNAGDRVELYRTLIMDPKEARRQRVEKTRKRLKTP